MAHRQGENCGKDDLFFAAVVLGFVIVLAEQMLAALVGSSGDGGLPFTALYNTDTEMGTGQKRHLQSHKEKRKTSGEERGQLSLFSYSGIADRVGAGDEVP